MGLEVVVFVFLFGDPWECRLSMGRASRRTPNTPTAPRQFGSRRYLEGRQIRVVTSIPGSLFLFVLWVRFAGLAGW